MKKSGFTINNRFLVKMNKRTITILQKKRTITIDLGTKSSIAINKGKKEEEEI